MVESSSVAAALLAWSIAAARLATFTQSRLPLLNSATRQRFPSKTKRKSPRTNASTRAADSDPIDKPNGEISLILTSSDGSVTPNKLATRQRARRVVNSVENLVPVDCDDGSHSPAGNSAPAARAITSSRSQRSGAVLISRNCQCPSNNRRRKTV